MTDQPAASDDALSSRLELERADLEPMLTELREAGFVETGAPRPTAAGVAAADRIHDARCREIAEILDDWQPSEQPEVRELIDRFSRELGRTPPPGPGAQPVSV